MFRVSGCVEEVLMCVCRFDVEVCGDGAVFVEYNNRYWIERINAVQQQAVWVSIYLNGD